MSQLQNESSYISKFTIQNELQEKNITVNAYRKSIQDIDLAGSWFEWATHAVNVDISVFKRSNTVTKDIGKPA